MGSRVTLTVLLLSVGCSLWAPPPEPTPTPAATPTPRPTVVPSPTPLAGDLDPVPASALGDVGEDLDAASLVLVLERTIEALSRRAADAPIRFADAECPRVAVTAALAELRDAAREGASLPDVVERRFRAFRSVGREGGPLVTGYYEPVLDARRERTDHFTVPIYRRPPDLVEVALGDFLPGEGRRLHGRLVGSRLEPYFSRRAIDEGSALAGRGLELAWLDDAIEAFFLHVQGSGILRFADGRTTRIGFAASNGHPYTSIGQVLRAEGALAPGEATAQGIRRWLRANPERAADVLARNERYIFFREVESGPIGSMDVVLTPGRSVAADPSRYPLGTLAWIETAIPNAIQGGRFAGMRPAARLVVVQDTGAAITGPGRIDLFFGSGDEAGAEAGGMSSGGNLVLLFPDCPPSR